MPRGPFRFVFASRLAAARVAGALCGLVLLAGCATPASIKPGEMEAEVRARFGRPDSEFAMPEGGKRLEYNRGEFMQLSWMVDVDAQGRVRQVDQVRNEEHFARLRPGVDDQASTRRALGTPWKVEYYPPSKLTAWLYPYREAGVYYSVMAIMFDPGGVFRRAENAPDPRFIVNDPKGRE